MSMTWMEAVAAMREGKRVKRRDWYGGYEIHWCEDDFRLEHDEGDAADISLDDYEADDWEVCE